MKEQLLKWGFEEGPGTKTYGLFNQEVAILVILENEDINSVCIFVNERRIRVPNCTTKLALFAFLYNLGLIEI